jgi:hypothetical protein
LILQRNATGLESGSGVGVGGTVVAVEDRIVAVGGNGVAEAGADVTILQAARLTIRIMQKILSLFISFSFY